MPKVKFQPLQERFPGGVLFFSLLLVGLALSPSFGAAGVDVPLPTLTNSEASDLRICQARNYRGDRCESLMTRVCNDIQDRNRQCLSFKMRKCHSDDSEKVHSTACLPFEKSFCVWTDFKGDADICELFQEQDCAVKMYKTRVCLLLRQKLTIKRKEDKLGANLFLAVIGHRNALAKREELEVAIDELNDAIADIDKQLSDTQTDIIPGAREKLKKRKKELRKILDEIIPVYQDAVAVYGLCESISPLRDPLGEFFDPNCDSNKDSRCPKNLDE